ncbi:hypothetical protein [Streptomyces chrestomyceticus]|uniref:hypothetical protein n=1 Tax=Streptomyces chrestomyceticus TaxID=68185 RepID=UPI0019D21391|nr:hypothetical protein [Streptomyces chrestomyceticus]
MPGTVAGPGGVVRPSSRAVPHARSVPGLSSSRAGRLERSSRSRLVTLCESSRRATPSGGRATCSPSIRSTGPVPGVAHRAGTGVQQGLALARRWPRQLAPATAPVRTFHSRPGSRCG